MGGAFVFGGVYLALVGLYTVVKPDQPRTWSAGVGSGLPPAVRQVLGAVIAAVGVAMAVAGVLG